MIPQSNGALVLSLPVSMLARASCLAIYWTFHFTHEKPIAISTSAFYLIHGSVGILDEFSCGCSIARIHGNTY
jgi:hypothetical protein